MDTTHFEHSAEQQDNFSRSFQTTPYSCPHILNLHAVIVALAKAFINQLYKKFSAGFSLTAPFCLDTMKYPMYKTDLLSKGCTRLF